MFLGGISCFMDAGNFCSFSYLERDHNLISSHLDSFIFNYSFLTYDVGRKPNKNDKKVCFEPI